MVRWLRGPGSSGNHGSTGFRGSHVPPAKAELVTGELCPPKGMSKPYPRDPMGVTFCGDRLFARVMTETWGLQDRPRAVLVSLEEGTPCEDRPRGERPGKTEEDDGVMHLRAREQGPLATPEGGGRTLRVSGSEPQDHGSP